ncbi:hypothetical protein, partial [Acidithiobacillus caldus]|uniref:hypothetical protein n=1 Tax=Acidithiobacillus caldus TaxID=33059 RepID=UPI001F5167AF
MAECYHADGGGPAWSHGRTFRRIHVARTTGNQGKIAANAVIRNQSVGGFNFEAQHRYLTL